MLEEIKKIIFNCTEISPDTDIREDTNLIIDLNLDSLELASIVGEIEDKYEIQVENDEMYESYNIKDVITLLQKKGVQINETA
jgi:acyl carrier protein